MSNLESPAHSQRPSPSSSDISLASSTTLVQESGGETKMPPKHDSAPLDDLIPSWTTLAPAAPASSNEERDTSPKPRRFKSRSKSLSRKGSLAPEPISAPKPPQGMSLYQVLSQLSQQSVPNTATIHSSHDPRPEQRPPAAPRQGSSRKQVFIGVVIPTRRSIEKSPTKTRTRAEPGDGNNGGSTTPTIDNTHVPQVPITTSTTTNPESGSQRDVTPTAPLRAQHSRKAKDDATGRGILRSMGMRVVEQAMVDAVLNTDVAPMQIDASRGGDGRRYGATSRHVRFSIPDRVIGAGGGEPMQVDGNEKRGRSTELRYAELEQPRRAMFLERLEAMFGPGDEDRGSGRKPKKEKRVSCADDVVSVIQWTY